MNIKIFLTALFLPFSLWAMNEQYAIQTIADESVATFFIGDLQNVRRKTEEERQQLFKKLQEQFPLAKALAKINSMPNPQVIIWFSNYFGSVMKETACWYRQAVFNALPKATFWLTDLKAWALLSVEKRDLLKLPSYQQILEKIAALQHFKSMGGQSPAPITAEECPFIIKQSDVLGESLKNTKRYAVLSSQNFFKWLLTVKDKTILDEALVNKLCKEYLREESLRFSLRDINYCPEILNRILQKNGLNILDVDFSLIFPILQYLEGVYYASIIIEETYKKGIELASVIFLLPNKEFTYYTCSDEKPLFSSFAESVRRVLAEKNFRLSGITILFQPFAYGNDFYDAPYKCNGNA